MIKYILIAFTAALWSAPAAAQAPLTGIAKDPAPVVVETITPPELPAPAPIAETVTEIITEKEEATPLQQETPATMPQATTPIVEDAPISAPSNSKEPLEITADDTLEWRRGEKRMIARGNALAVQGTASIAAATLTADYREGEKSNFEIHTLSANIDVILKSETNTVYGDKAIYELDKGLATVTGDDLRLVSPDQTVTARDRFEYWVNTGKIHAIGNATVIRPKPEGGEDRLKADKITATLKKDANGKQALDTLEAFTNVVITTPTEKVTGAYGIYHAKTNIAELKGGVTITRGQNILQGERAEVNLNTNTSKIFSAPGTGKRVSGTFFPGSEKKPE